MWAKTRDTLLVVEPGTPAGYARIIAARAQLIAAGAHVAAPCPHDGKCPLTAPDWCHFTQRLPRLRAHKQIKGAELPFEDEKFSYVALTRAPAARHPARVLAQPAVSKVEVSAKLCTPDGVIIAKAPRRAKADYARARRWRCCAPHRVRDTYPFVPRMRRSAPHLRRGALLIRGPPLFQERSGSRLYEAVLRTASRPGHVPVRAPDAAQRAALAAWCAADPGPIYLPGEDWVPALRSGTAHRIASGTRTALAVRAPDAAQRAALAAWCAADRGPFYPPGEVWVPALRSSAAHRIASGTRTALELIPPCARPRGYPPRGGCRAGFFSSRVTCPHLRFH
jgi:hypothetical protein